MLTLKPSLNILPLLALAALLLAGPAGAADDFTNGLAAFNKGDYALATEHFAAAAEAQPEDALPLAWLGLAQLRAGRSDEAVATLTKTIELDPKMPEAHHNLGNAYWDLGKTQEAVEHYQQAVFLQPLSLIHI